MPKTNNDSVILNLVKSVWDRVAKEAQGETNARLCEKLNLRMQSGVHPRWTTPQQVAGVGTMKEEGKRIARLSVSEVLNALRDTGITSDQILGRLTGPFRECVGAWAASRRSYVLSRKRSGRVFDPSDEIVSAAMGQVMRDLNAEAAKLRVQERLRSRVAAERVPEPTTRSDVSGGQESSMDWDVFICHASEDKDDFVRPLADALLCADLKVWYDDFSLKWGDSLRCSIDRGLAASRYGIVVLSPAFFEKRWPQIELDGLVQREVNGKNVILPVWHKVTHDGVARFSLTLAGRVARESVRGIDAIVAEVVRMAGGDGSATGLSDRIMERPPGTVSELTGKLQADTSADAAPAPTTVSAVSGQEKVARLRSGVALRFPKEQERILREGSEALDAELADFRRRNMIESSFAGSAVCKCISETIGAVAKARVDIELEVLREAGVPLDRKRADALRQEVSRLVESLAKGVPLSWQLVPNQLKSADLLRCISDGARTREIACHRDIEIALNAELLRDD